MHLISAFLIYFLYYLLYLFKKFSHKPSAYTKHCHSNFFKSRNLVLQAQTLWQICVIIWILLSELRKKFFKLLFNKKNLYFCEIVLNFFHATACMAISSTCSTHSSTKIVFQNIKTTMNLSLDSISESSVLILSECLFMYQELWGEHRACPAGLMTRGSGDLRSWPLNLTCGVSGETVGEVGQRKDWQLNRAGRTAEWPPEWLQVNSCRRRTLSG